MPLYKSRLKVRFLMVFPAVSGSSLLGCLQIVRDCQPSDHVQTFHGLKGFILVPKIRTPKQAGDLLP